MDVAGKRVLVVGMGISGVAAARLANRLGARVTCTDVRQEAPEVPGCAAVYGQHRDQDFLEADLLVVSPGVPLSVPQLVAALDAGVPAVGELAFAAAHLDVPILAITGTNGKSSTTHFAGELLRQAGRSPFVGGNLGNPLSNAVGSDADIAVVEVSSYQLELPGGLHPVAAAILNLTPDHLGRHGSLEAYAAAKCRLFDRMEEDEVAAIPQDAPLLMQGARATAARQLWLDGAPGVRVEGQAVVLEGTADDGAIALAGFSLLGQHNRQNAAAAALLCVAAGVRRSDLSLGGLTPLPHRLELVHTGRNIRWVNDSKATNVEAAVLGVGGVGGPLVVLLGGQGKDGADYQPLRAVLRSHARAVVCFGAAGPSIAMALNGLVLHQCGSMAEAVALAAGLAEPGDAVLLSPACASFDEFANFEARGEAFAALAREAMS